MLPASSLKVAQSFGRSCVAATRAYSAAAAPLTEPLEDLPSPVKRGSHHDVKVSSLANGIKVASCDTGGALSRVAIAVQAGSRHEARTQLGISHVMKNAAFITNATRSSLLTTRTAQQAGGSLEASNSRELLTRKAAFLRNELAVVLGNIAPGLTSPQFNAWDLPQVKGLCTGDLAGLTATAVNVELLHNAAFRTGLGNSIYADALKLANISADSLAAYCSEIYVGSGVTIAATDVDHEELLELANELFGGLESGSLADVVAPKYYGGESHSHSGNGLTHASLFGAGAGLTSADLPAFAVLQKLLGSGASIKWGSNTVSSKLNNAANSATDQPYEISAMNISYSDAGLFGVHAVSTPQGIKPVLASAVAAIQGLSSGISDEDLQRAKVQVQTNVLMMNEQNEDHLDDFVNQVVLTGAYSLPVDNLNAIGDVSVEQVVEISKQLLSNPTLAVNGNTSYAPYLDELL